jgi:hypothetical protein
MDVESVLTIQWPDALAASLVFTNVAGYIVDFVGVAVLQQAVDSEFAQPLNEDVQGVVLPVVDYRKTCRNGSHQGVVVHN